jgi:SAM-dependent methyltransferase
VRQTPSRGSVSGYRSHIYPYLVSRMGDPKSIREIRQRIVWLAQGTVLEIGAGSGANFVHYDPARVTKLYALEPNQGMIALAERQRRRTTLDVEFLDLPGERIPLENDSVDSIVSTFTLGTIPDVLAALRGMGRVLRPGGKLIFFELGLSPDPRVRTWQKWCDPIAHWLFEGLHLTRVFHRSSRKEVSRSRAWRRCISQRFRNRGRTVCGARRSRRQVQTDQEEVRTERLGIHKSNHSTWQWQ